MPKKQTAFEDRLTELEALVRKMEEGSMTLSETLNAYEEGVKLSRSLSKELDDAEKRMLELSGGEVKPMEDAP